MTFLLTHWWTLTSLTLAAFLFGVSIAGLVGIKDTRDTFPRMGDEGRIPDGVRPSLHPRVVKTVIGVPRGVVEFRDGGRVVGRLVNVDAAAPFFDGDTAA